VISEFRQQALGPRRQRPGGSHELPGTNERKCRTSGVGQRRATQLAGAAGKTGDLIEASVERIRELNEQAIVAARSAGQQALDAYQAGLESVVSAEEKLAAGRPR
jgi:hypothetical protein